MKLLLSTAVVILLAGCQKSAQPDYGVIVIYGLEGVINPTAQILSDANEADDWIENRFPDNKINGRKRTYMRIFKIGEEVK